MPMRRGRKSDADLEAEARQAADDSRKETARREAEAQTWRGQKFAAQGFAPQATLALVAWRVDHHDTAKALAAGRTHMQIVHTCCPLEAELPVEEDVDDFIASTAVAAIPPEVYDAAKPAAAQPDPPEADAWKRYHGRDL